MENAITTTSVESDPSRAVQHEEVIKIDASRGASHLPMLIMWISAVIAILGTGFFWLSNQSIAGEIITKQAEAAKLQATINGPEYAETDRQVTNFISAVTLLKEANSKKYPMKNFLPSLFAKINQNVKVTNISLTSDGKFSISGSTVSYRAAAEQIMTFKEWKEKDVNVLKNVELASVSMTLDKDGKVSVPLSISAEYNNPDLITATASSKGGQSETK